MTVYRRPDPIPLPHARPVHGQARLASKPAAPTNGQARPSSTILSEKVAEDLALGLMAGRFLRSGVLWTEPQLCSAFGISRTALREAIKILSAKGIVETRRKRGTVLRHRSEWNILDPDVIRWLLVSEPERTTADLVEAMILIQRAAGHSFNAQAGTACNRRPESCISQVEVIDNPFLAAFAETATKALRRPSLDDEPAKVSRGNDPR